MISLAVRSQRMRAAAVLPTSRSVQVGHPATAFATVINLGVGLATSCSLAPATVVPASFIYQTTDPTTNALTGTPNTPVDIAPSASQSFVFAFIPSADFPPTEVRLAFQCDNAAAAPVVTGVNTLFLVASVAPAPDVIALARPNAGGHGILTINVPPGAEFLAVAAANFGAGDTLRVSADTGDHPLPLVFTLCQNDPQTGGCRAPMTPSMTLDMPAGGTATFTVMATASGPIAFDPANNRVFVRFVDAAGVLRGVTSVGVQSPATVFTF